MRCKTKKNCSNARAFTLAESMVVVLIVALFATIAMLNLSGMLTKSTFKAQANEFVSAFQMAANAAAESERKYEIIVHPAEQTYTLRQITTDDLSQVLEEEIIIQNSFSPNCTLSYIQFDDGDYTSEQAAKFRVSRSGFQYGGKIVLLDKNENPYSVVVNRLSRIITLQKDDVEILTPKSSDEIPF